MASKPKQHGLDRSSLSTEVNSHEEEMGFSFWMRS